MIERVRVSVIVFVFICCSSLIVGAQPPCGAPPCPCFNPPCVGGPGAPPPANPVPITGIEILIGAGALLGAKRMIANRKTMP